MKEWLKEKLTKLLGLDELKKDIEEENKHLRGRLQLVEEMNRKIVRDAQRVIVEGEAIVKQFNLSADINHYENHSWAVISIAGKPEYVRFVDLSNRDMREVHMFLKQFEGVNKNVDSPLRHLKF